VASSYYEGEEITIIAADPKKTGALLLFFCGAWTLFVFPHDFSWVK